MTEMLNRLKESFFETVEEVKCDVDQVAKLTTSPGTSPHQQLFRKTISSDASARDRFRDGLLHLEKERQSMAAEVKRREREMQLRISALELKLGSLQSENNRLRWEPRKARDGLVFLCVALSSAFVPVCFALFAMAERQRGPGRSWEDQLQGSVLLVLGSMLAFGAVPLTHMSGMYLYGSLGYRFYQPGEGGRTFVVLQALSWVSYGTFLSLVLGCFLMEHVLNGTVTAAGSFSVLSQVLMVTSLLSFRPSKDILRRRLSSDGGSSESTSTMSDDESETDFKERRNQRASSLDLGDAETADNGMEFDLWLDADLPWNAGSSSYKFDTDTALFGAFIALQFSLVTASLAVGFLAERAAYDNTHRVIAAGSALLMLITAALLTHALGGALFHRASWRVFRPFAGGTKFLLLQGIVWGVFGMCVATQASFIGVPIYISSQMVSVTGMPMTSAGVVAILGHFLLVLSISYYREHETAKPQGTIPQYLLQAAVHYRYEQICDVNLLQSMYARMTKLKGWRNVFGSLLVVALCNTQYVIFVIVSSAFYGPYFVSCLGPGRFCVEQPKDTFQALQKFSACICVFTIGYSVLKTFDVRGTIRTLTLILLTMVPVSWTLYMHQGSPILPLLGLYCSLFVLYNYKTYSGSPEVSGCREWPAFRTLPWLWDLFQDYQGGQLVTDELLEDFEEKDGNHALGSASSSVRQAICCFHPHGIFPTTMIWLPNSRMFSERFPGFKLTSMTASIIHLTPLMRDICHWAGVRDVGRESVDHALRTGASPMLVVGGQSEMFLSKSWTDTVKVHQRHRGFIRMAIRHGVPLIPIFSFGEHKSMDNVHLPRMQAWSKKRFGFPIPYFPYGRWFLPVTRRTPITVCVGSPVHPVRRNLEPTKAEIDDLHQRYFAALHDLFERNKAKCGFPNAVIEWA